MARVNEVKLKGYFEEYTQINQNRYRIMLKVKRKNETYDTIPCEIKCDYEILEMFLNMEIEVIGQICSKNIWKKGKRVLDIYIIIKDIKFYLEDKFYEKNNKVNIEGFVCKKINLRKTKFKIRIADIMVAINMPNGISYYIPCIAWEEDAKNILNYSIGDYITIEGRIQSRIYYKKDNFGRTVARTINEVSITKFK